jgi:hypothetical protein
MKKPINKVAVFIWIIAAVNIIGQAIIEPSLNSRISSVVPAYQHQNQTTELVFFLTHLANIRIGLVTAAILVGLGAIVELLDRIRWEMASKK